MDEKRQRPANADPVNQGKDNQLFDNQQENMPFLHAFLDEAHRAVAEMENKGQLSINGMPNFLQNIIKEYVSVYDTPRDFITGSIIQAIAFAIGSKYELIGRYTNVPILWMAIIGDVSSGKTHALNFAFDYFTKRDAASIKQYSIDMASWETAQKDNPDEKKPECFQYLLNDYTPEALTLVHSINNRGLMIYRDELKGWLDDFGRYSKSGEQSNMLSSYYRQSITYNRKGSGILNIPKPCIFVAGGIQPDLIPSLAGDQRAENGFLSRFCFVYPRVQKKPKYSNKQLNINLINDYNDYLERLVNAPEKQLHLSDAAEKLYADWYSENADKSDTTKSGYLKGVYGKLDVIALRLAIVFYGMRFPDGIEITPEQMQAAIDVTEYFRGTAEKVYQKLNVGGINEKLVIKYLSEKGQSQTQISEIVQKSQPYINKVLKKMN